MRKPVKRKFDGKVYNYLKGYTNKNDAIRNSEILRKKGNLVRRVKGRMEKITNRRYNYLFVRKK